MSHANVLCRRLERMGDGSKAFYIDLLCTNDAITLYEGDISLVLDPLISILSLFRRVSAVSKVLE